MEQQTNKTTCPNCGGENYSEQYGCSDSQQTDPFIAPKCKPVFVEFDFDSKAVEDNYQAMFWGLFIVFAVFALLTLLSYVISKQP